MKEEIIGDDETLFIVTELGEADLTINDLKKDSPDKIETLQEALNIHLSENNLFILKTEFPDKWKYLKKIGLSL